MKWIITPLRIYGPKLLTPDTILNASGEKKKIKYIKLNYINYVSAYIWSQHLDAQLRLERQRWQKNIKNNKK